MRRLIPLLLLLLTAHSANAALLSNLSDIMSHQSPNVTADHSIRFKATNGIIGMGSSFTIQFAAGFNLSALAISDVQMSYGSSLGTEIPATLASSATASEWGYSRIGQTITFTHPAIGFGDISAGYYIEIEILNEKVINPATNGYYVMSINTSGGDDAVFSVLISTDNVTVNATVGTPGRTIIPPTPILTSPDLNIVCPIFRTPSPIGGGKPLTTEVFVNNSNLEVSYFSDSLWKKIVSLVLGANPFEIYARYPDATTSPVVNGTVIRCQIGDVNCNSNIDDFDLSGLAFHWLQDWCQADFNADGVVDDFDLAGQAAHWNL